VKTLESTGSWPRALQLRRREVIRRCALSAVAALGLPALALGAPAASASTGVPSPLGLRPEVRAESSPRAGTDSLSSTRSQRAIDVPPSVAAGNGPTGLAVDHATHTLYVTNQNDDSVSVINTAACQADNVRGCGQHAHTIQLAAGSNPQAVALDAATGTAYVADTLADTISVIDIRTCNAVDFSGCHRTPVTVADPDGPIALAIDQATDSIYVANIGDGFSGTNTTVSVIDGARCNGHQIAGCAAPLATLQVGAGPDAVAVDQATDSIYVAIAGTGDGSTVSVINGATCNGFRHVGCGQHTHTLTVGAAPAGIVLDPSAHTAYTANIGDSTVSVINTETCNAQVVSGCGQVTTAVPVGANPFGITVDQNVHTAYVADSSDDTVSVINTSTCNAADRSGCAKVPATSQVGAAPQDLVADPSTGTLYTGNVIDNDVSVSDVNDCDASHTSACRHPALAVSIGGHPGSAAVDEATGTLYVTEQDANTVSVIDADTCDAAARSNCAVLATVNVPGGPSDVIVDQANGTVYTADIQASTVTGFNADTCNARDIAGCAQPPVTEHVGSLPNALDVDQSTGTIYTANIADNDVSVMDANTCNAHRDSGCTDTPPTVATGPNPIWLAVNQITHSVYVSIFHPDASGDTVQMINTTSCNAVRHGGCGQAPVTVAVGPSPLGIAVDQRTNMIYVANNNNDGNGPASLSVINGATCDAAKVLGCSQPTAEIPGVGRGPNGIAVDPSTHTVYTANVSDSSISVVNVAPGAVAHPGRVPTPPRIAVGTPLALAIDHANHTIYVLDPANGTVAILPERPIRTR
jgi:DNA-binding beta-propeller fold protein YncE